MAGTKMSLKLLIDPTGKKVIFAEAGKDFVDFLVSILALPVGRVVAILSAGKMVGSLGNLYHSINSFSSAYMQPNQNMNSILKSQAPVHGALVPSLLPKDASLTTTRTVYKCRYYRSHEKDHVDCRGYVADDPYCVCPHCKSVMNKWGSYVALPRPAGQEGYVKGAVTYMIMDDLEVKPLCTIAIINLLSQYNVKDSESLQQNVVLGMEEGIELLRASLQSKTVLTDVLLSKK